MTRRLPIALALGVTLTGLALLGAGAAGLRVNATASMPRGLWRVAPAAGPIPRGAIVSLCLPPGPLLRLALRRGYLDAGRCPGGAEPLLKPVAAIAGDVVRITAAGIAVNGALLPNSAARKQDSAARPLSPLPPGTYRVAPGAVWVVSSYAGKSFDSRYFGAVPVSAVRGTAQPVWVFP
ncbi:MAG TPA: conjugative transfer signal peptidase TraF [Stellaceae bacterium]|nr:conjugative transfer signal peptidase TraF [Stellaceae bacterium]